MFDELRDASNLLRSAVEQYHSACFIIRSRYESGDTFDVHSETILNELDQANSYVEKLLQSTKSLGKLRNHRPRIAPINSLPPELLARIFHLASTTEHCFLQKTTTLSKYPSRSPESLLRVCSYWRSVALASHTLWTHVDLAAFTVLERRFIHSGRLFAQYAGQLPLNVHINVGGLDGRFHHEDDMLELCASIAERARRIEIQYTDSFTTIALPIFGAIFANCTPGRLSGLIINNDDLNDRQGFIIAQDSQRPPENAAVWTLELPHCCFEEVMRGVTVLRLDGIYPHWTSCAYQGLVKLHLSDTSGRFVAVSQLSAMLKASPQLRYFYFGVAIIEDALPDPIYLNELEVFHIEFDYPQYSSVLRLVIPGSKPLRVSTILHRETLPLSNSHYREFLTRSNIVQLRMCLTDYNAEAYLDLVELLRLVPSLTFLTLDGVTLRKPLPGGTTIRTPPVSPLAKLHLTACTIELQQLSWVVKTYPCVEIKIDEPTCWFEEEARELLDPEEWKDKIVEIYPGVEFGELDPVKEDWY